MEKCLEFGKHCRVLAFLYLFSFDLGKISFGFNFTPVNYVALGILSIIVDDSSLCDEISISWGEDMIEDIESNRLGVFGFCFIFLTLNSDYLKCTSH
jgi:hypothetical protein